MNDIDLLESAVKAAKNAYAPYSHFPVGAAVLTRDGKLFAGCNVENASYGLTLCAERVAVVSAVAAGTQRLCRIAIIGGVHSPVWPCGACLQVLCEFCDPETPVVTATAGNLKGYQKALLKDLLPRYFHLNPS